MDYTMLNIPHEPDLEQRLNAIASKSGHSTTDYLREAIREMIEDQEDIAAAEAVLKNPGRRWSMEEAARELDLED
jgi:RHH-type transcriptional regulator, rel operon repressor / antitoxin RelB